MKTPDEEKRLESRDEKGRRKCVVAGCFALVPPLFLMCPPHWRRVPRDLQRQVRETYQHGQEKGLAAPSKEWREAVLAAIGVVTGIPGGKRARKRLETRAGSET